MSTKTRGFSSLLGLLLIAVVLVGAGAYFLGHRESPQPDQMHIASSTNMAASSSTVTQSHSKATVVTELCTIPRVGKVALINDGDYKIQITNISGEVATSQSLGALVSNKGGVRRCYIYSPTSLTFEDGFGDGGEIITRYTVFSLPNLAKSKSVITGSSGGALHSYSYLDDGIRNYFAITEYGSNTVGLFQVPREGDGCSTIASCTALSGATLIEKYDNASGTGDIQYTTSGQYVFTIEARNNSVLKSKVLP